VGSQHQPSAGRRFPALHEGVLHDLEQLPTTELRLVALRLLVEIEAGRVSGKPFDSRAHTGDLSDCFKVCFDHPRGDRPSYRIVYRVNPDKSIAAAHIEAVAVGRRAALAVYRDAARRIERE
jgi:hypothetical protein